MAEVQQPAEEAGPTVKAVLAEAKRLRERAELERAGDPWAKPYDPSDDTARKLSQQLGPQAAIDELRRRAAEAGARYREESERSDRSRARLDRRQRASDAERRQRLSRMSLGARLDEALAALALVSDVPASTPEAPISRGKPDSTGGMRPADERVTGLRQKALVLVAEIEDELPRLRRKVA